VKRIFDFVASLIGLITLSPILIVVAIWIKLDSPGPVFFRQDRIGQFSIPFKIHKFRTMVANAESLGNQITVGDDRRITRSGAFLRKYKLDELPQLIDVLLGQMSLVGPRPEVAKYVAFYSAEEKEIIHSIRPGITDNASIEYRDENKQLGMSSTPEETYIEQVLPRKIEMYKQYVSNHSFSGDMIIILKTIFLVLKSK
jgi:lipopolysaccharide/colanic/teichoic acid biosynthesis glycosyltransferase